MYLSTASLSFGGVTEKKEKKSGKIQFFFFFPIDDELHHVSIQ